LRRGDGILFLPGEIGERALRARLVAGEDAAYRECYEQFAPRLMRIVLRVLRDQASAEEILQETFIAAFRSIAQFRGSASLSAWLTRIAINRAFNAVRDEARRMKNMPPPEDEAMRTVEPRLEGRDLTRKVLAILDEMDPSKKVALLLQAEGYSVAEIAEISNEPRGTILARLSRSRAELSLRVAAAGLTEDGQYRNLEDRS
jgi:RNA polymerase sigma-70 factor (ECF subfamily)